jgi:hypothetical protein
MSEGRLFRSIFDPVDGEFGLLFFLEPDHAKSTPTGSGAGPETVTDKPKSFPLKDAFTTVEKPICLVRFVLSLAQRRDVPAALNSRERPESE